MSQRNRPALALLFVMVCVVAACAKRPSRLEYAEIESEAVGRTLRYAVWAPQDLRADEALPLVVFLHGGGGDEERFDAYGVGEHLDDQLAAGRIPRVVIAVPEGRLGFWENWYDGSRGYRDWVVDEVMPHVQARYPTRACPRGCHVAGVSMGAHGALRLVFFHPDRFASASSLSGLILSSQDVERFSRAWFTRLFVPFDRIWGPVDDRERVASQDLYVRWRSQQDLQGVRLLLAWAEQDRDFILESNRAFHAHLLAHDIEHEQLVFPGRHAWRSWRPVIGSVLRFAVWGDPNAEGPARRGGEGESDDEGDARCAQRPETARQ